MGGKLQTPTGSAFFENVARIIENKSKKRKNFLPDLFQINSSDSV
jgi:hypothetical protein